MAKEVHGFLWGALAAVTSSGMGLFVKLAGNVPITTLVFIRFVLAFPILLFFLTRKRVSLSFKEVPMHFIRSLAGIAALYCYYIAIRNLSLVNAVTLRNTAPLFMPVLSFFWLKVVVSKRRVLALGIGFLGVVILLKPTESVLDWASLLGVLSGLLSAVAMMSIRQLSKKEPTKNILSYYFLIGMGVTFIPMAIEFEWISDPLTWLYVILAGLSALIFQYTITKAYTHAPATKVSSLNYLGVFFGGFYGWLFFNEVPDKWVWGGAFLIILGALLALTDSSLARHLKK